MYKNITVIGCGYVGTSIGILCSQKHNVHFVDIDQSRVDLLNANISPVDDSMISKFLQTKKLNFTASTSIEEGIAKANLIILALPTNFDIHLKAFNTQLIKDTVALISKSKQNTPIVIKSTVPIGFTESLIKKNANQNIIFCPEFLTEGNALADNLYPSRIILGGDDVLTANVSRLLKSLALNKAKVLFMSSGEAEAVKLFSNSYLALRISFFNELDSLSLSKGLSTQSIITGMAEDPRIGDHYNNPSFGYGGYCLPKDTKQLNSHFKGIASNLTQAIVKSNDSRKKYIAQYINSLSKGNVGIYRLNMKAGSDNYRNSAMVDIVKLLKRYKNNLYIYEPLIKSKVFKGIPVLNDLSDFKKRSDIILANRTSKDLDDVGSKVFSRDLFNIN